MKTVKLVKAENPNYTTLINGVIKGLQCDNDEELMNTIQDVINNGINCGFGNFILYTDTHKFAIKHRKSIIALLEQTADDFGEDVMKMVSGFGIFRNSPMDNEDRKEVYAYLGGGKTSPGTITNIMCWFAVEEVCRWFESYED